MAKKRQKKKKKNLGVPAVSQRDGQHLCSARTQVQSLAWHSGLKDPVLLQLLYLKLGSNPWPENSVHHGLAKKKKKKKNMDI